jgi:hypothetical protein
LRVSVDGDGNAALVGRGIVGSRKWVHFIGRVERIEDLALGSVGASREGVDLGASVNWNGNAALVGAALVGSREGVHLGASVDGGGNTARVDVGAVGRGDVAHLRARVSAKY